MNEQEERKAFEKHLRAEDKDYAGLGYLVRYETSGKYKYAEVQARFDTWLFAKEHAKPIADVFQTRNLVGLCWTYANAWGGIKFDTKEEATAHALERGFRLKGAAD